MRVDAMCKPRLSLQFLHRLVSVALVLASLWHPDPARAANQVSVVVLPLAINAPKDLDYLSSQIADTLANLLKRDGAVIVPLTPESSPARTQGSYDPGTIQKIGRELGVDRVIWGSFTLIGEKMSMDFYMQDPGNQGPPTSFHAEGDRLENLLKVMSGLSRQISMKLFHREVISAIRIAGNHRIESDAILRVINSKVGSIYQKNQISKDLKAIFEMGYFDDLRAEAQSGPEGISITFHVKEKPTIRRIKFSGNNRFDDDTIKSSLTISTGAILNINKLRSNIDQIETMYKDKNYHQVKVTYKLTPLDNNQADIEFIIDEGPKLYVTEISFEGNKSFSAKRLKKVIQTSEKGFFYWLTSSGDLDRTKLDQDVALLNNFYLNQGYINARVADPNVDIGDEGIHITFKIKEGSRFKVGRIDVAGDLILSKEELLKDLSLGQATYFNREKLRNDVITLTDLYGVYGYAYADIKPQIKENPDKLVVDVTYDIQKKQEVYYENIFINGNTRTRDKVIRRELLVNEQERFDGAALKRSIRRLYRLDYFEDIKVDSLKGSGDDKMVLKIDVTEKPTGMFTFGAGYSSEENVFLVGSIAQRNLFGRGQILRLEGQIGGSTSRYNLSFTEPWLFDIPLSATVSVYDQYKEYTEYERYSQGGGVGFSYPLREYTRVYLSYAYDSSDVTNIDDTADDTIKELEGTNVTSSISLGLGYDSRDSVYTPSEGSKHSITFEYAGLGGDVGFNKITAETGWYIPIYKGLVFFAHARAGSVTKNADDKILPDYEKFYLGGINSLRGFDYRGVHISDVNSDGDETIRGGTSMVQGNFEILIPIVKKMGIIGVVFFDTGNVYDDDIELGDLRKTAGYGLRWFTPLGIPFRIEYGQILDRREGEDDGRWEFNISGAF